MHPAPSVILFTTLSGLGFGLLAFLGLGYPGVTGWVAFVFYAIAYGLAVGGLLASTFHLGHPERALKAFGQWKTSWLSREGLCAVAALLVMGLYAIGAIFMDSHWRLLGVIGAALSLGTVFTTSMIYCQLKTIPRWNMPLTPVMFVSFSIAGGALLAGQESLAIWLLLIAGVVQLGYWVQGDKAFAASSTTMATATGLGDTGATVRAFEPPHTGSNYLLREFVHVVGVSCLCCCWCCRSIQVWLNT
jgi:DMSO reductase anchor subunit